MTDDLKAAGVEIKKPKKGKKPDAETQDSGGTPTPPDPPPGPPSGGGVGGGGG